MAKRQSMPGSIAAALVLASCAGCHSRDQSEFKKAKAQATLFLDCVKNHDGKSAYALLSEKFMARLSPTETKEKSLDLTELTGDAPIRSWQFESSKSREPPKIDSRVVFNGTMERYTLSVSDGSRTHSWRPYEFRLVLVHDPAAQEWRIDLFTTPKVRRENRKTQKTAK